MDQIFVINTVAASAADLTTPGAGKVLVTGDTNGFIRENVDTIKVLPHKAETLKVVSVTATAAPAANTEYVFRLSQLIDEEVRVRPVHLKTGATAPSATAFGIAVTAAAQAVVDDNQMQVTLAAISAGNGGVTVTGAAGNPLFSAIQPSNMTIANAPVTGTSSGNLSVSGLILTLAQSTTTAFAVGQTVYLSGWNAAYIINGKTSVEGAYLRVYAITAATNIQFVAESVSGTIGTAVAVYSIVPQEAAGSSAVLALRVIASGGNPSVSIVSTNNYHEVVVTGGKFAGKSKQQVDLAPIVKRYFVSDTGSVVNANALLVRFKQVNGYLATGGAFDPLLLQ